MATAGRRRSRFRAVSNGLFSLVLILFAETTLFPGSSDRGTLWMSKSYGFPPRRSFYQLDSADYAKNSSEIVRGISENLVDAGNPSIACRGIERHDGFQDGCEFLKARKGCGSGGYIDYLRFFYCSCRKVRFLGYAVLALWVVALFYMLGNTAADYFCCSLEKLSALLRLSPTVAGVTLLPLGNGAPDVFASIAAFVGTGAGDVGLNSVLGGAVFVTCVVVGAVSLCIADKFVQIDQKCFVRDICFFMLALISLSIVLVVGKVTVWGAVIFLSIYVVYAFTVAANEILRKHAHRLKLDGVTPLLPVRGSIFSHGNEEDNSVYSSLLEDDDEHSSVPHLTTPLPQWMWASNFAIYSNHGLHINPSEGSRPLWGWMEEANEQTSFSFSKLFLFLEMPLTVPRRLTIPIVEEDRWSKVYAVVSAGLAPVLVAILWNSSGGARLEASVAGFITSVMVGTVLALLAFVYTSPENPPRRFLFPWVFGGFVMSIIWFYIIANELVALLVSLGVILDINPSILGLTVLAWGNSMGDMMSNIALALNGEDGVQIAMSGCYAGPMFNTLVGLGASMLLGSWSTAPASYVLPHDKSIVYTMGFLIVGLAWALVLLPRNGMRPNKMLGVGLLALYFTFLGIRVGNAIGILSLPGLS